MRLLLEILAVAALIGLAWDKSFKERAGEIPWIGEKIAPAVSKSPAQPQHPRVQSRPIVTPAPSASGAWMWDPNRKTPLDTPRESPTPHN